MPILIGDLNNDGTVDVFDLSFLVSQWGSSDSDADLNNDGTVDASDLSILVSRWANDLQSLPSAPSNLSVNQNGMTVELTWDAEATATSYRLYRSETSGENFELISDSLTSTSYEDNSVELSNEYFYVLRAVNDAGWSAITPEASISVNSVSPSSLSATASTNAIELSWDALNGADAYDIQRSTTVTGTYSTLASGVTGTTYSDTTITPNPSGSTLPISNNYYYRIVATSQSASSNPSIVATGQPWDTMLGDAVMSLSPQATSVSASSTVMYTLAIDAGSDEIDTVQARLYFNPDNLTFDNVDASGSDFSIFDSGLNDIGADYVELVFSNISSLSGQLMLATIDFTVNGSGQANIIFDSPRCLALTGGDGLSLATVGARIDITN